MSDLAKSILVTGASKGIGLEAVKALLGTFKCNVTALSRSCPEELQFLQKQHSSKLEVVEGDVANEKDQQNAIAAAVSKFGKLDGLLLNAGVLEPVSRIVDADVNAYKAHFDVNFFSLVTALKLSIPHLRQTSGKVIFTSSGAAVGNYAAWSAYNASKAALNSLCRTAASEEKDITFLAVRPGVVDTGMQELLRSSAAQYMSPADAAKFTNLHADGKLLPARKPGYLLAALTLHAPKARSGEFVDWQDSDFAALQAP